MNKTIANVVFYKFLGEQGEMQQACIFYEDGTVKNVSHEEGLEAAQEIAKQEKIKTQADFVNMLNKKHIYTLSGSEFENRFKEFLGKGVTTAPTGKVKPAINITPGTKTPALPAVIPPVVPPVVPPTNPTPTVPTPPVTTPGSPIVTPPTKPEKKKKKKKKSNKKKNKKNNKKKKGLFSRIWAKVTAVVLAITMAFTGGYFLGRNTKSGDIVNNNINNESQNNNQPQDEAFLGLLAKTTNKEQKATMKHQGQSLDLFNRDFADAHIEEGKDVKAALTWDEMMALNIGYNTYSKDQIKSMFNGAEVDSTKMSNAYKNATLQLMGAYVISTRENPVNSSQFLVDEEQKAFVEKYNDLFLTMKEKTGAERVAAIDAFYTELHKDFPITAEVREEGISHADSRSQVEPYKAAVSPIVAAAEIMFQNTNGIDHTLSDKAIAYFNDLGLCNIIDEQFERAETITLAAETDKEQPLYEEFRNAKINELIYEGNYPTDDAHRDLSQLDEFQKWVNGHFLIVDGVNTGEIVKNTTTQSSTTTETKTSTETKIETTNNREEAVSKSSEEAVKKAETAVDQQLEQQNQAAKQQGETAAEQKRQELQKEADRQKEQHSEEVAADDQEMQDMINDANNTITNNGQVNEDDFGDHDVDFDNKHEDGNGNLDESVGNITTDGSGAVDSTEPLPDPNQTGATFDGQNSETTYENTSGQEVYEYEEPYVGLTNEEIVDAYIASLENQNTETTGYQYTK